VANGRGRMKAINNRQRGKYRVTERPRNRETLTL
jgi:hypothetical protein